MKQLSGLDASFLYVETPEMPMHVGALHVFELPAGFRGRFATHLRRHIAARLPLVPVLRRKLAWMPFNLANPAWVDAQPVLTHHVVEQRLPARSGGRPGDMPELEALVARLHMQLLDRGRPLWRFHVIEGLAPDDAGRRRVALYTQVHHAAVDGQAAMALAAALFDTTPQPPAVPARPQSRIRQIQLGRAEMLGSAVVNQVQQLAQLVRTLPATVSTLSSVAVRSVARTGARVGKGARPGALNLAPRTRLNASVTAERAFATASLPLDDLRRLARLHEVTLNDVVLWLCSTALRRHFGRHGPLPRQSLVAAVPVSLRAAGDDQADNQASITLVSLGTQLADPLRRLAHIKAATTSMKATVAGLKDVLPTDFPSIGVPWLLEAATALIGRTRAMERIPALANLAISNVPGPAMPLYLAGARMLHSHPTSIIVHGIGLNITVQSYDQSMDFGLMACAGALPRVREVAQAIEVALDDLRALGVPQAAEEGLPAQLAAAARQVIGQAVDTAARAVPGPVSRAARSARRVLESSTAQAAAAVVPRLARDAVAQSVSRALKRKRG